MGDEGPLGDREAGERTTEMLAWVKASAEGDQAGASAIAPDGLDEVMAERWGGVAVLTLLGLYTRGLREPDKPLSQAMAELWTDMVGFREFPPDEGEA